MCARKIIIPTYNLHILPFQGNSDHTTILLVNICHSFPSFCTISGSAYVAILTSADPAVPSSQCTLNSPQHAFSKHHLAPSLLSSGPWLAGHGNDIFPTSSWSKFHTHCKFPVMIICATVTAWLQLWSSLTSWKAKAMGSGHGF